MSGVDILNATSVFTKVKFNLADVKKLRSSAGWGQSALPGYNLWLETAAYKH
jgi:hypothetical protein